MTIWNWFNCVSKFYYQIIYQKRTFSLKSFCALQDRKHLLRVRSHYWSHCFRYNAEHFISHGSISTCQYVNFHCPITCLNTAPDVTSSDHFKSAVRLQFSPYWKVCAFLTHLKLSVPDFYIQIRAKLWPPLRLAILFRTLLSRTRTIHLPLPIS